MLVQKGRIWDRPLFEYLDAGESARKQYVAFLLRIPSDFAGVESVQVDKGTLIFHERGGAKRREFRIAAGGLIPE